MENDFPIGVFDSGVGGLTVLRELIRELPNEKYIYFADLKNSPYGNKTGEEIFEFSSKIIEFLVSKGVKLIAVACNTASSYKMDELRKKYKVPIITVLESGVEEIKSDSKGILLAATKATVESGKYDEKIKEINSKAQIYKVACIDIVDFIENRELNSDEIASVVDSYMKNFKEDIEEKKIDTLILGCTHYPIWQEYFEESVGKNVDIINPAKKQAEIIRDYLTHNNMLNGNPGLKEIEFFSTDKISSFNEKRDKILNRKIESKTKKITF